MKLFAAASSPRSRCDDKKATISSSSDTTRTTISDCIICGDALGQADAAVVMPCSTADCHVELCLDCLERLAKSAQDDYQTASDGSRQVKTRLQCPMCRGKYQVLFAIEVGNDHAATATATAITASKSKDETDSAAAKTMVRLTGQQVVLSVVVLRQAHYIAQKIMASNSSNNSLDDSCMNSTDLTKKDLFLKQYSWQHLRDCHANYVVYMESLPATKQQQKGVSLLQLLEQLQPYLQGSSDASVQDLATMNNNNFRELTDPTLFLGLDELLTPDEQDFCSQLLVSKDLQKIHQACLILQGMLQITRMPPPLQQSSSNGARNTAAMHGQRHEQQRRYKNLDQLRKRYPLPTHMPRCVRLLLGAPGAADCLQNCKHFVKDKCATKSSSLQPPPTLELKVVRGLAGHVGLRRGDVITHVEGEAVESFDQFQVLLAENLAASYDGGVLIGVNICDSVAQQLQERNAKMKTDKVRFEYS